MGSTENKPQGETLSTENGPDAGHLRRSIWAALWCALRNSSADNITTIAGGVTFFILLAIFPAITCVVSLYGMFANPSTISHELRALAGFLPGGAMTVLDEDLQRLAQQPSEVNIAFFVGLLVALWSARGGVSALMTGLDVAFEARETRNFVHFTLDALKFTVVGILFAVVAIGLGVYVPGAVLALPFRSAFEMAFEMIAWPLSFAACSLLAATIYYYGPARRGKWQWISWGSGIASVVWIGGTKLFTWYVASYGSYNRVYGSLGAVVGFLTWVWLSVVVLLFGAEINRELERWRRSETSAR